MHAAPARSQHPRKAQACCARLGKARRQFPPAEPHPGLELVAGQEETVFLPQNRVQSTTAMTIDTPAAVEPELEAADMEGVGADAEQAVAKLPGSSSTS